MTARRGILATMSSSERAHATSWALDAAGAIYERGRPGYPLAVGDLLAERLELGATSRLADVAAGTGKLTRLLAEASAGQVIAVEPLAGMRSRIDSACPGVAVVAAKAEQLPFASGSLDAVTVAQAFHWFDLPEASTELARVLGRRGRLALVNNRPRHTESWQADLWRTLHRYEKLAPRPAALGRWRQKLDESGVFGIFHRSELPHYQKFASTPDFDARIASISHVLLLDPAQRRALMDEVHALVAGRDPIVLSLTTVVEIATVA